MFKNLGLFAAHPCPEEPCHRPRCLFAHGEPSKSRQPTKSIIKTAEPAKRKAELMATASLVQAKRLKNQAASQAGPSTSTSFRNGASRQVGPPGVSPSKDNVARPAPTSMPPPRPIPPAVATRTATIPTGPLVRPGAPTIPTNIKLSPQPWADRQKALNTLFTQFTKLYAKVLSEAPDLASKSALAQEGDVSVASSTLGAYKTAIHHAAVSVSRRPAPDTIPHPSIGTVRESREAYEAAKKEAAGRLTREKVVKYCLPVEEFGIWGYPDPRDMSLTQSSTEPDAEGTTQTCDRCKISFVVSSSHLASRFGECRYHYGRTAPQRVEGRRKWIYSCCGKERGETGCEEGIHVFSEKEDDQQLAKRAEYRTVRQVVDEVGVETKGLAAFLDVVAVDCEMIYTTSGVSLGRATVIDEAGNVLLDEVVRQKVPVLDLNTRFSGIIKDDLAKAVMELPAVRAAVCMFIGPETIIVGHGLENDLRAMRLLHAKVIDTAVLFPHDKGRPYRRALRDIVKEKLGYFIQDRTSDFGHSSAEDAKATLEVLKWKVRDDAI